MGLVGPNGAGKSTTLAAVMGLVAPASGRIDFLGERLDGIKQELQELERRSEARCKTIERRIETTQTQTDHVRALLAARIDHARRDLGRIVLLGLLGTTVSTALLCLGTILLAL